jgi:putative transposase
VTTDGHNAYPRAIRRALSRKTQHRHSRYLNNRLEQDHRGVKQRYYPMRGFGSVASAARFCSAHDELHDYLRSRGALGERVPLAEQRRLFQGRWTALMRELTAA